MNRKTPQGRRERAITPELIRDALSFIPPDVGHNERARMAFAVFDGLGDAGKDLWLDWAAQRSKPDHAEDASTWRSAHKPGPVKVGTLFGVAKDHGFRFPDDGDVQPADTAAAKAEAERVADQKRQQRAAQEAEYQRRADMAARDARALWASASEAGESPYLSRKGVQGHGVRFLAGADGCTLIVPMRDAAGELQNVQRIAPVKPANGDPEKRFMPGGRKSGLWHLIGSLDGAAALLLAEGYATAASLHEATGSPVAVAFDAGNLVHVAKALRELHPTLALVVCGDDDRATEARTGKNPGREKAATAARAALTEAGPAGVVFPEGLPDGGSDFNDLATHMDLAAVRSLVEAAISAPTIPTARQGGKSGAGAANGGAAVAQPQEKATKRRKASASSEDGEAHAGQVDRFTCDASGVWYHPPAGDDGGTTSARRVCDRLEVLALGRDTQDKGGALLLDFDSKFGPGRRWLMPMSMLAGDGTAYRSELLDMGFMAPTDQNRRRWLTEYLISRKPPELVRLVEKVGWHGRAYVMPRETLLPPDAAAGETIMFHSDGLMEDTFAQRGTVTQWQERIGAHCRGNSRLTFAVCAALAGPVLAWVPPVEGGGWNLRGDSSSGKTTALRVCASVFGGREFLQQARASDNGLEGQALQYSDACLPLDELGQLDPRVAGEAVYMLANGRMKTRGAGRGGNRKGKSWRLLFLSAGELSLAQHMNDGGKTVRAGQELRMIDLPADAGASRGLFETLHDFDGGAALAQHLAKACESTYGTVGRTWIEWLVANSTECVPRLRKQVDALAAEFVDRPADGQVKRGARRFALAAAAGEEATTQGLTGWAPGEATAAVLKCFHAWISTRPAGWGSSEKDQALRTTREWFGTNADANLTWWHRALDDHRGNTPYRAGFRRFVHSNGEPLKLTSSDEYCDQMAPDHAKSTAGALVEYLIFPDSFRNVICKGLDYRLVVRVLKERGSLKFEQGHDTIKESVPGMGRIRMYRILPSVFMDPDD